MALSRPSTSGNYNHLSRPSTRADSRRSNEDVFMLESNKSISDASILGMMIIIILVNIVVIIIIIIRYRICWNNDGS